MALGPLTLSAYLRQISDTSVTGRTTLLVICFLYQMRGTLGNEVCLCVCLRSRLECEQLTLKCVGASCVCLCEAYVCGNGCVCV